MRLKLNAVHYKARGEEIRLNTKPLNDAAVTLSTGEDYDYYRKPRSIPRPILRFKADANSWEVSAKSNGADMHCERLNGFNINGAVFLTREDINVLYQFAADWMDRFQKDDIEQMIKNQKLQELRELGEAFAQNV